MSARVRLAQRRLALAVAVGLALGAIAGCDSGGSSGGGAAGNSSAGIGGDSAGDSAATPSTAGLPADPRLALGDVSTLDPCSLVDLTAFNGVGTAAFGDPESLDYCVVRVDRASGSTDVHVGQILKVSRTAAGGADATAAPGGPTAPQVPDGPGEALADGLRLVRGAPSGASCTDALVFDDSIALLSQAVEEAGSASAATCAAAYPALSSAIRAIASKKTAHRTYPAQSFGPVEACDVLLPSAVSRTVPALRDARALGEPSGHQCEFGQEGKDTAYVALVLAAAYQRFDGGPGSTTLTVHGQQVVLVPGQPDGRDSECVGYGPHIAFPSRSGSPAMEMAELHVALPDGAKDGAACAAVRALAPGVFGRLP